MLLVRFRRQFVGSGVLLAVAAGAVWAASVAVDFVQGQWGIHALALEDGAKLIGTALWAAFMVWSNLAAVAGGPHKPAADHAAQRGSGESRA